MTGFVLDARLAADTAFVADWPLSRVLLMNDARFPWLILVPRRAGATEIFDLNPSDRQTLAEEMARAGERLKAITAAAKINLGALGNLVRQLHVHIVARNATDAAWPGPVWGQGRAVAYEPNAMAAFVHRLANGL
jgi:diadenosine tetraphosphate (Ap4A) HIT family hydrolase